MQCIVGYCYEWLVVWCRSQISRCAWKCPVTSSTHDGFAVAGHGLLVLAAEEQAVALLLELQRGGAFLGAACHLLHRICGGRPPLLTDPVPRLFGEHRPVPGTQIPAGANLSHCTHTHTHQLQKHHLHSIHIRTTITLIYRLHNTHIWTLISPWQLWQMIQTPPAAVNIKLMSCDQNRVQKNSSI